MIKLLISTFLLGLLLALGFGFANNNPLVPYVHFVNNSNESKPEGAGAVLQFRAMQRFKIQKIELPKGLRVLEYGFIEAFGKTQFELRVMPQPGQDLEFDHFYAINGQTRTRINIGPNRVADLRDKNAHTIGYDIITQVPVGGVLIAMRLFNDTPQVIELLSLEYAPSAIAANRVVTSQGYNADWFTQLEEAVRDPKSQTLPRNNHYVNSKALGLVIKPGRSISMALTRQSLTPKATCAQGGTRTRSHLQPILKYRVAGVVRRYPIPDEIMYEICL